MEPASSAPARTATEHSGRGLCRVCYGIARKTGRLGDYARLTQPTVPRIGPKRLPAGHHRGAEVLEEYRHLASFGLSDERIAESLGMQLATMRRAIRRAEARERIEEAA